MPCSFCRVGVVVVPIVARRRAGVDMGHMSRRVRGQALGLVAAGFLSTATLGACTSGETPTSPPSAPSSIAVAPTTTVIPTTSAMTDEEAAIAAAKNYYEEFNRALVTLDSTVLRALSAEDCRVCDEDREKMAGYKASGRKMVGGQASFTDVSVETRSSPSDLIVKGRLEVQPLSVVDATGKTVDSYPRATFVQRLWMIRKGDAWRVQAVFS